MKIIGGFIRISLLLLLGLSSIQCSKDYDKINKEDILLFLDEKGWEAEETESGLFYIIDKIGTGGHPNISSTTKVDYRGYYLDDEEFDSSYKRGKPSEFALTEVIEGWQEGIPLFMKGGIGKLIIPSSLGYGSNPQGGIRKNAVLVFEIKLIDFK